jgi:hypothetical protein
MKEPLPEWGPAERNARLALNCLRYEVAPAVANDLIGAVLAAFAELRGAVSPSAWPCECGEVADHAAGCPSGTRAASEGEA